MTDIATYTLNPCSALNTLPLLIEVKHNDLSENFICIHNSIESNTNAIPNLHAMFVWEIKNIQFRDIYQHKIFQDEPNTIIPSTIPRLSQMYEKHINTRENMYQTQSFILFL